MLSINITKKISKRKSLVIIIVLCILSGLIFYYSFKNSCTYNSNIYNKNDNCDKNIIQTGQNLLLCNEIMCLQTIIVSNSYFEYYDQSLKMCISNTTSLKSLNFNGFTTWTQSSTIVKCDENINLNITIPSTRNNDPINNLMNQVINENINNYNINFGSSFLFLSYSNGVRIMPTLSNETYGDNNKYNILENYDKGIERTLNGMKIIQQYKCHNCGKTNINNNNLISLLTSFLSIFSTCYAIVILIVSLTNLTDLDKIYLKKEKTSYPFLTNIGEGFK